jgi:hypothetical protein
MNQKFMSLVSKAGLACLFTIALACAPTETGSRSDAGRIHEGCEVPCNVDTDSELGQDMVDVAATLDSFNNDAFNPECSEVAD